MNYILMEAGYKPVIIKSKDKTAYINALNKADTGDMGAFICYIGGEAVWSLGMLIKAAKGESIADTDDADKGTKS